VLLPPVAELSLTDVKTIFDPAVPCASRVPSTVRLVPSNCTTAPAWIVSVTPCAASTLPTTVCTSVLLHSVSLARVPLQLARAMRASSTSIQAIRGFVPLQFLSRRLRPIVGFGRGLGFHHEEQSMGAAPGRTWKIEGRELCSAAEFWCLGSTCGTAS